MATPSGTGTEQGKPPLYMKHVDFKKDNVSEEQLRHIQKMEKQVQVHAEYMKRVGRKNKAVALGLSIAVAGIFTYSIYSVGTETFLDNFDDPNKPKD